jgi:hypothetical protein
MKKICLMLAIALGIMVATIGGQEVSPASAGECWQAADCIGNTISGGSAPSTGPSGGGSAKRMVAYSLFLP